MLEEIAGSLLLLRATVGIGGPFNLTKGTVSVYEYTQNQEVWRLKRADVACHGFSAFALLACWFTQ